ncbi:MAG: hypothetical protein U1B78_03235 [Dehalococcoidia bacterium]|nr:hypothetical protein [Dehalococcoidia bacterium]
MTEQEGAEEAAHAQSRAVLSGDMGAIVHGMTPEGFAKAMEIGNTSWNSTGYEMVPLGREDDAYVFDITFQTEAGPLTLRERFRQIDGAWKMVDIERSS